MPFLSIIIPVYNKGQYLNKCIQSIVEQSFTDWEIILVDDGSTDSSPTICDQWSAQDVRIHVIHQRNAGVSTARNNGVKHATGEYIQFTDADDWWDSDSLHKLHLELTNIVEPDLLIFGLTKIVTNGCRIIVTPEKTGEIAKTSFFSNLIQEQSSSGIFGCVANKIISRKFIIDNELVFNDSYKLMEDYDFFLSAYERAKIIVLSQFSGYLYLQGAENSSTSSSFIYNRADIIKILIKSYRMRVAFCGISETDLFLIGRQIGGQIVASFFELQNPSYYTVKSLATEHIALLKEAPMIKLIVTGFSSHVVRFLLVAENYWCLSFFLKIKRSVSRLKNSIL